MLPPKENKIRDDWGTTGASGGERCSSCVCMWNLSVKCADLVDGATYEQDNGPAIHHVVPPVAKPVLRTRVRRAHLEALLELVREQRVQKILDGHPCRRERRDVVDV